ncbi:MAG TPA: 4'-phosphopantetheinyl transferase superfamily protein [Candidatus Limnocylindrales bacterium]|nr:4'-phosphopantetheinyl transferase superfamily protein [Candidatus Limnocylindrales bacterium]
MASIFAERHTSSVALFDVTEITRRGALAWATSDDRACAADLDEQRRRTFIAARAVLRALLREYGIEPALPIQQGRFGKPSIADAPQLRFSISHAGRMACVATSLAGDVGVDIERGDEPADAGVIRRFFSPSEAAALAKIPEGRRARAFTEAWTRREAVLKAVGLGLGVDAEAFSVTVPPAAPAIVAAPDVRFAGPLSMHRLAASDVIGTFVVAAEGVPPPQRVDAARLLVSPPRPTYRPDRSRAPAREGGVA